MIDLTNVALRRSPHEKFEGPFITCAAGDIAAEVDRKICQWYPSGLRYPGAESPVDLIPYTPAPVARKWLKCNHGRPAPMIERAAAEALADALRGIRDNYGADTYAHDIARAALAVWEAGL